ncbi:cytochrome P450 family protein [Kitasatospora sp. DSM 101779]|uniref:cytochrome P450 family protein n=1 Tax=Kitasatospora sp. DSM 101779 TaxID=2853165 RepID=UPI0021D8DE9B|nr:cytochrome P450 [Kitasatospora sp. DSM 101779]
MLPPADAPVPLDEGFLADPHGVCAGLHRRGAVHRAVAPDTTPLWLITGYEQVREAAADPRLALDKRHARSRGAAGDSLPPELDAHLLNRDGADHARLRRLVAAALGPRRTEALREPIRRTADALLDHVEARGRGDVVADLAAPLAVAVICDLLGVPSGHRVDFRVWTDTLLSPDPGAPGRSRDAMRAMHGFLGELIAHKRAVPGDDLLSELIAAERDPQAPEDPPGEGPAGEAGLTERELLAMAFLLLFAGYHNTVGLISGTVLALLTRPRELAAVRAGRLGLSAVTEEVLRWDPPAMLAVRRFPTEDLTVDGTRIAAGDRVWLSWAAANRDPARFPDPDAFDPARQGPPHLAFGRGPHFCAGAALARAENEIAVGALLRRFPRLALDADPATLTRRRSLRSRCPAALPVRV